MQTGRVVGVGGIFFKSPGKQRLEDWYRENLGIDSKPYEGALLPWRSHDNPEEEHKTVWSVFPESTAYFGPGKSPFMINYIVDDLDVLLEKLQASGVPIDPNRETHSYGKFAWIYDPDGNKVELWQPIK
jgi:catechol 2,3-dioxygenase-like lactoylglutathione lyase family enzyme